MDEPLAVIIEDNRLISDIYIAAAREAGYQVIGVSSGAAAIEKLRGCVPALVVLDLHLPEVPGVTVLQMIRSDPRLCNTRVIVVSGDATLTEFVRDQADLVLVKPVGINQLMQMALRLRPATEPNGAKLLPDIDITRAAQADLETVLALLHASDLPYQDLSESHLDHFLVAREIARDTRVLESSGPRGLAGVIGLEPLGSAGLLRSLAVRADWRGHGLGQALVKRLEELAGSMGVYDLYLLTTTAAEFFAHLGYVQIVREQAPAVLQETTEFRSLCPDTAVCMVKRMGSTAQQ